VCDLETSRMGAPYIYMTLDAEGLMHLASHNLSVYKTTPFPCVCICSVKRWISIYIKKID
jgi:hypothetical protein